MNKEMVILSTPVQKNSSKKNWRRGKNYMRYSLDGKKLGRLKELGRG